MIDAHHHLWNYNAQEFDWISEDMSVIRKSFRASDLDQLLTANEVSGAIAVQARTSLAENDFLLNEAALSSTIKGVVGWIGLKASDTGSQLDQYRTNPLFKGVREITQGAADSEFLSNSDFNAGIKEITKRDLSYDLLIFQDQLATATEFVDAHPNQRFVLDHAAKPEIRAAQFPDNWESAIREIAKRDHLVCKISGLVTEVRDDSWNSELMQRYIDVLLDAFGPSRLMFGSDWPVCLLASEYARWKSTITASISQLSQQEQQAILHGTASQFYSL